MSLTILALLAAPAAPQACYFDNRVFVTGVVASVAQAPAAPFDQIAVGEPVELTLAFHTDVGCMTPFLLDGLLATQGCTELKVGNASALLDPTWDPCLWGESFVSGSPGFVDLVSADAAFGTGQVRAILHITDDQGLVGIASYDLITNTVDVPSVTAPGFSIGLSIVDIGNVVLAEVTVLELSGAPGSQVFGGSYCTAVANSTGNPAYMSAMGTPVVFDNNFVIQAYQVPQSSFGYFLVSPQQAFITNVPNSSGNLCVGGNIGRFIGPGQIQYSGTEDNVSLSVDLTNLPTSTGLINVQPGQTWNFTYWYRDFTTVLTSNFANGLSLTFM